MLTYRIPDGLVLALGVCGVYSVWPDVAEALIAPYIIAGLLFCVKVLLDKRYKTTTLGWGDVKLSAVCGFFFPIESLGLFFFIMGMVGMLSCLILKKRLCPLGPAIFLAMVVAHYGG